MKDANDMAMQTADYQWERQAREQELREERIENHVDYNSKHPTVELIQEGLPELAVTDRLVTAISKHDMAELGSAFMQIYERYLYDLAELEEK